MLKAKRKYGSLLIKRNVWLFTLISFLIVLFCWLTIMIDPQHNFSVSLLYKYHTNYPFLFIFDALPIFIFIVLNFNGIKMKEEIDNAKAKTLESERILKQNSDFATALSEGDDPDVFEDMLNSDIGRALKLIHLNMKSNRRKEKEITWITEGKDMISRILRAHNDTDELSHQILLSLSKYINAVQGAVYLYDKDVDRLINVSLLAYNRKKFINQSFRIGEGLVGQCAYEMDYIHRTEIPDSYITISSGILGDQKPRSILLVPLITNQELQGVMEFAFLENRIPKLTIQFLLELGEIIARTIFNLRINETTRLLLAESQKMTEDLRDNEQTLQENALSLKSTGDQLQKTNIQLQKKIEEAQMAQDRLHWLLENSSEIISIYDENYRLNYISPSAEHILGYNPKEMMRGKDFERIDQNSAKEIRSTFDHLKKNPDETIKIKYVFVTKDGVRLHLSSTIRNSLRDPSIKGFIFNTRDITESIQIEKEQRLKSRMQSLSENSLDLILRINYSGIIHYANPVFEDYSGIDPLAILNKPLGEAPLNKDLQEILTSALHRVRAKPVKFDIQESVPIQLGDKTSERILNINVIPEFQENELETVLFVGHDITEAKRIEAEIKITSRKIQDSINYAERIQSSILPSINRIQKAFPKSFIYYAPKDVISGDFPWFRESENAYYIAAIDCTGHGVPGALLSFIGFFLLNNITALHPYLSAGDISDLLNDEVKKTLKQDQKNPETRDGMDMALCKIYKNEKKIEFVGAHRPLYLLRDGELIIYKGDRKAIGGLVNPKKPDTNFTNNEISFKSGDKIFIFSDGLTDQLGADDYKYSPARLREILVENPGFTINQFHDFIKTDFNNWMGNEAQIDDVLLIGIEL